MIGSGDRPQTESDETSEEEERGLIWQAIAVLKIGSAMDVQLVAYRNYSDLSRNEREGLDYKIRIRCRKGGSPYCVMAPHGGGIELGTSEISDAIAGDEHAFYAFEGLKVHGNAVLHLPSISMDEPKCLRIAKMSETVISVHGCRDDGSIVYIGGLDSLLILKIHERLSSEGFTVSDPPNPELQGRHPQNICNLSATGKGVQLEITVGLRRQMFSDLKTLRGRKNPTQVFRRFVEIIQRVLR